MLCIRCGKKLEPNRRKWCSNKCYYRVWQLNNRASINKRGNKYYSENPDKFRKKYSKFRNNNPEKIKEQNKQWLKDNWENYYKKHKKEHLARNKANTNIKIPKNQLCVKCNKNQATDKHHKNYNKPLEVEFLCSDCHYLIHRKYQI